MTQDSLSLSRPPQSPFILSIPTEVLHYILSFLPDPSCNDDFIRYKSDGKDYEVAPMLILRSVCRKFRAITVELNFWYDSQFLFADLATSGYYVGSTERLYQEERFLKVLFSDSNLVDCLGRRKTEWRFESLPGLTAVMAGVPLFKQNARIIYLEIREHWPHRSNRERLLRNYDIAIRNLSACAHITTLNIQLTETINLNEIASSFPKLEVLCCTSRCSGSLRELNTLRKLNIGYSINDLSTTPPMLPLNSAETLTELALGCVEVRDPFFDIDPLDAFINLKSLIIGPLCDSVCDFLVRSRIRLEVFETSLIRERAPIDMLTNMLRAECLRDLKEFGLTYNNYNDTIRGLSVTERYWSLAFDAFTSILLSVEKIRLAVPLHEQGCALFARMVNLKLLIWDGTTYPFFGCGRSMDPKEPIVKALDGAFANFMEKPQFAVHFILT